MIREGGSESLEPSPSIGVEWFESLSRSTQLTIVAAILHNKARPQLGNETPFPSSSWSKYPTSTAGETHKPGFATVCRGLAGIGKIRTVTKGPTRLREKRGPTVVPRLVGFRSGTSRHAEHR